MKKRNNICFVIIFGIIMIISFCIIISKNTIADNTDTGIEVSENTEIMYFLTVKNGVDTSVSKVNIDSFVSSFPTSGYIKVEDQLPLGLEFLGFSATDNGTFQAYDSDNNNICSGNIVDDTNENKYDEGTWNNNHTEYYYHGLHYNTLTRKVSYMVENLGVNCYINVGINVKTNNLDAGVTRKDFYNVALVASTFSKSFSNVVHHFIGNSSETLYQVSYVTNTSLYSDSSYPKFNPILPPSTYYSGGSEVLAGPEPYVYGYRFTGWSSSDVTITDEKFTMPNNNVEISANFTPLTKHSVTYSINSTVPADFSFPATEQYYEGASVKINSLKKGDVINGLVFDGWVVNGITIGDNTKFIMPDNDVNIVGQFKQPEYSVIYRFSDDLLPPNASSLLPASETYSVGDEVTLPTIINPSGYYFKGWNKKDNFKMPAKNVVVYGTWIKAEYVNPNFHIQRIDTRSAFRPGDIVLYSVSFDTNDSELFYEFDSDNFVKQSSDFNFDDGFTSFKDNQKLIGVSDNSSSATYSQIIKLQVPYDAKLTATLNLKLTNLFSYDPGFAAGSRSSDVFYYMDEQVEFTDEVDILSRFMLCSKTEPDTLPGMEESYIITGDNGYKTLVSLSNYCMNYYLDPGDYTVQQVLPFSLKNVSIEGVVDTDNEEFTIVGDEDLYLVYNNEAKDEDDMPIYSSKNTWIGYGRNRNYINYQTCGLNNP